MTRASQKRRESEHIELFIRLWPEWAARPPTVVQSERPDAILAIADQSVGLEHTTLVSGTFASGHASAKRFKNLLTAALNRTGIEAAVVMSFRTSAAAVITRNAWKKSEEILLNLARNAVAKQMSVELNAEELVAYGVAVLRRVAIDPTPGIPGRAFWTHSDRGPRGTALIENAIAEKDDSLQSYRADRPELDAFWLLLITGDSPGVPDWDDAGSARVEATFERVFFLDRRQQRVRELI